MPYTTPSNPQPWQLSVLLALRQVLQDVDEQVPLYEDEALRALMIASARLVIGDLGITTYNVLIEETFIDPDPSADVQLCNLIMLRSHLMLATGEWRKSVKKSVEITFGPRISLNSAAQSASWKDLVKELRAQYELEKAKYQLTAGFRVVGVMSGTPVGPEYPPLEQGFPYRGQFSH